MAGQGFSENCIESYKVCPYQSVKSGFPKPVTRACLAPAEGYCFQNVIQGLHNTRDAQESPTRLYVLHKQAAPFLLSCILYTLQQKLIVQSESARNVKIIYNQVVIICWQMTEC